MGISNIKNKIRNSLKKNLNKIYLNHHETMISFIKKSPVYECIPDLVFLVPPTTAGSLGDEAMVVACYTRLIQEGKRCIIVSGDVDGNERLKLYGIAPEMIGIKGLYDGFLGIKGFQDKLLKYQPECVYLIGADVMDGFYSVTRSINRLTILKLASEFCTDTRLLGFSFNAEPEAKVLEFFKKCSGLFKIQPRDPVSAERLTRHKIENRCVADLAFLLTPDHIIKDKILSKAYICINLNAIHLNKWGIDFFDLSVSMVEHLFKNTEYQLVFVSHDFRKFDGISDYDFARKVTRQLKIEDDERVIFIDEFATAAQLKGIASGAYFAITGRMHFAIAALGNAIPTIMIGYQGKQEGLAQHFGLDVKNTVITPTASKSEAIYIINNIERSRDDIFSLLESKLSSVKALSNSNIQ